ncbi:unnamed protein product [Jaminaea pallidilutea]
MADIEAQGTASQHAAGHRSSTSRTRSSSSSSSSSRHNVHPDSRAGRDQAGSRGGDQSTVVSAYPSQAATPKQPSSDAEPPSSPTTATVGETEKEPPQDTDLVDWDGPEDPENPKNWSQAKKWVSIGTVSSCSFCVTCNSSIVTSTFDAIAAEWNIGREVAILGLSLFVAGLGTGPMLLGPASEMFGRKPIYVVSFSLFLLLQFPVAFANNPAVFFIFRFLTGLVGSAFLSVAGGTVSDLYTPLELFPPMCVYSGSPFLGPTFGPLIGNFIVENTTWRWVWWTTIIWTFVQLLVVIVVMPETYGPKLLMARARRLRKQTGRQEYYTAHEKKLKESDAKKTMRSTLTRVPQLLSLEPMLLLLCIWSALLLGILYLLFEAFPIVFGELHGFTSSQTGLAFLGQAIGIILGVACIPFWSRLYQKAADRNGGQASPEARLPMCMLGSIFTPVGLFIFAFTSYSNVLWVGPCIALIPFGMGVVWIYTGVFTYTASTWMPVAASAMSANSLVRSAWAAAFPLFATQMYHGMGAVGASALLAGVNVLMIPIPFVLYQKGPSIRAKSRFTF